MTDLEPRFIAPHDPSKHTPRHKFHAAPTHGMTLLTTPVSMDSPARAARGCTSPTFPSIRMLMEIFLNNYRYSPLLPGMSQ